MAMAMATATQAWERLSSTVAPHLHHLHNPTPRSYALLGAASLGTLLLLRSVTSSSGPSGPKVILSPKDTVLPNLSDEELTTLPYPHHALPGARDVDSPYGTIRVYEWGPEDGDKMLLIHGISTPSIALADLAFRLVSKGCRVMLFDLFGRGFSAAPSPEHYKYDSALYTSQIMLCLSSSPISWNPRHSFTIIGYSLGGAIAADFASHFPNLVRGLILVAPGGLIRTKNISFGSKILYGNTLPDWMVRGLVARRLWTGPQSAKTVEPQPETVEHAETTTTQEVDDDTSSILSDTRSDAHRDRKHKHKKRRDSDKHRHRAPSAPAPPAPEPTASEEPPTTNVVYLSSQVPLLRGYPQSTVSAVVDWQVQNHPGFIPAFISSIRHAPVHNQHDRWAILRENIERKKGPLRQVWIVLGETDPIIIKEELAEDAIGVLGEENVKILVVEGAGHEVGVERGEQITEVVERSLGRRSAMAPVSGGKKTRSIRSVMKSTKKRGWF